MPSPSDLRSSRLEHLMGMVQDAPLVGRLEQLATEATRPLLSLLGSQGRDVLHGRYLGHALHPALTDLPIGFWTASVLADRFEMDRAAGLMSAAGCISAVPAALSGITDWSVSDGRDRRLALVHGLLNTAGLGLQLLSLAVRVGGRRRAGRRLSVAGWAVSGLSAYIGGELAFGRGLMVDHTAWISGPEKWTPVLPDDELPQGGTRCVEVDGRRLLLHREGGQVRALEDACSHAGGPLSEGEIEAGVVTCPWHGSQFRVADGSVAGGPATHPQPRLQVRTRNGKIEVRGAERS
jgi:nitrite reductase/ring-hydroxylating ferredoxin subunit